MSLTRLGSTHSSLISCNRQKITHRWRNWGSETPINTQKVKQLVREDPGIKFYSNQLQGPSSSVFKWLIQYIPLPLKLNINKPPCVLQWWLDWGTQWPFLGTLMEGCGTRDHWLLPSPISGIKNSLNICFLLSSPQLKELRSEATNYVSPLGWREHIIWNNSRRMLIK